MSYSMVVVIKDGKASVEHGGSYVTPPDGKYQINGHTPSKDTWPFEQIQVTRYDSDGNTVAQANAIVGKPILSAFDRSQDGDLRRALTEERDEKA